MSDRDHAHLADPFQPLYDRVEARGILACLRIKAMFMPMAGCLSTSTALTGSQMLERLQNKTPPKLR